MDSASEELSKRLHEVIDVIGASEYFRQEWRKCAMVDEILRSLEMQVNKQTYSNSLTVYHVGSTYEGTTTPGLNSDLDIIYCYDDMLVIDNISAAKQKGISYLIVTDEFTKPGYVLLQEVEDQFPIIYDMCDETENCSFKSDRQGRICITHSILTIRENTSSRNGPADTYPPTYSSYSVDIVPALKCRQIPSSANAWLHKKRRYDWPSQAQLKAMARYGCFLVRVGHPQSENKSIEWRISFTLQERDLMLSLNETQHKCYILLKMIKKDIIESNAGESISSYHCKTSLFYTIEDSKSDIWKDSNLIHCARLCLIRILSYVKANNCPNYFIPEENMFDKLSPITLKTIENILIDLIDSGVDFLFSLNCDNVGELLKSRKCGSELICSLDYKSTKRQQIRESFNGFTRLISIVRNMFLFLHHANHVTEHSTREVRMAFDSLTPHIQLQYDQCMLARYLSSSDLSRQWFETFPNAITESSSDFDLISTKLALASLYIQSEQHHHLCQCILVSCENSLEPYLTSVCACQEISLVFDHTTLEQFRLTELLSKDFRRSCTTGCMIFHPSQVGLVHEALRYELSRTVYTPPDSNIVETHLNYWLNWITIDSQIYLYFLQYLFYFKTKKNIEMITAVKKLSYVIETDRNLGHVETAFNIFGWICLKENELEVAWSIFCKSWKIRPFKNAAKWHMLILLSEKIN